MTDNDDEQPTGMDGEINTTAAVPTAQLIPATQLARLRTRTRHFTGMDRLSSSVHR